jgi:hypothetical protein
MEGAGRDVIGIPRAYEKGRSVPVASIQDFGRRRNGTKVGRSWRLAPRVGLERRALEVWSSR